jgi:hypothetical protein
MERPSFRHSRIRWALVGAAAVALVIAGFELAERETSEDAAASGAEPASVEHIDGTGLSRVALSASAAERIGLETAVVRRRGGTLVVPYSTLLYDETGRTWVYTSPQRLTFVRAPVAVQRITEDSVVLSAGPRAGTTVAAVGVAELYGTEFEVDH